MSLSVVLVSLQATASPAIDSQSAASVQTAPAVKRHSRHTGRWVYGWWLGCFQTQIPMLTFPFFVFKILIMQTCISLAWSVWLSGGVVLEGHGNIDVLRVNGRCESGGV